MKQLWITRYLVIGIIITAVVLLFTGGGWFVLDLIQGPALRALETNFSLSPQIWTGFGVVAVLVVGFGLVRPRGRATGEHSCPSCGAGLRISIVKGGGGMRRDMSRRAGRGQYNHTTETLVQSPDVSSVDRTIPLLGPDTDVRAVWVPFQQTLLLGLGIVCLGEGIVLAISSSRWLVPPVIALILTPIAGAVIFAFHNKLLRVREIIEYFTDEEEEETQAVTHVDVYPDKSVGDGPKTVLRRTRLISPKRNPDGLADFCYALLSGRAKFSHKGGKNTHGASESKYTRTEWDTLRKEMVKAGLAFDKGGSQGCELTRGGWAFARLKCLQVFKEVPSPTPDGGA